MDNPKDEPQLLYPTFSGRIVKEAGMFDVFRQWCHENVTPRAGAIYDTGESGIYPYPPYERSGPQSLVLYHDRRKWIGVLQAWAGSNAGAVISAGIMNRKVEKPW